MKIREGFVSNSSSTSFLIVGAGVRDGRLAKLAKADQWEEGFGGYHLGKTLVFLGGDYECDDPGATFEPDYVGIDAEQPLKNNITVAELRRQFINRAQVLGVVFRESEVDLHYGEVSSE